MDIGILTGIALIVIWGLGVWFDAPGWINFLLTAGIFVILWRVVVRGDRRHPTPRSGEGRARGRG